MNDYMVMAIAILIIFLTGLVDLRFVGQLNELIARKKIPQRKVKDIKWLYIPYDGLYNGPKLPSQNKYDGRIYLLPFIIAIIIYIFTFLLIGVIILVSLLWNANIVWYIEVGYFLIIPFVIGGIEIFYSIKYRKEVDQKNDFVNDENEINSDKKE